MTQMRRLHEIRSVGTGGHHVGPVCGSGWHGDCVHTHVQEPWGASCAYCSCRNRYCIPARSLLAVLLWGTDQRCQQKDRHGLSGLKRARQFTDSAWEVSQPKGLMFA